jgi:hypothetical protein
MVGFIQPFFITPCDGRRKKNVSTPFRTPEKPQSSIFRRPLSADLLLELASGLFTLAIHLQSGLPMTWPTFSPIFSL